MVLAMCCARGALAEEAPAKPALVASVNGKTLSEPEFLRRCEQFVGGGTDTAIGYLVLKEWLQQTLAEEEARKKNLLPTAAQVEARVQALRKQFEITGDNFEEWLSDHGRTLATLREDLRQQMIAENLLTEGVEVTDIEVQLYYETNKQLLGQPERLEVSRITVDDRNVALEVDAALKRGDAFEDLARKRSIDPYRSVGGRVATPVVADLKVEGPLEPEVLAKVMKLERGKVAGPIKLDGYWVFARLELRLPARVPALSDVQELLRANMKVQKGGPERLKKAQERLDQLAREAKVEIYRPEYQRLLKLLQKAP